MLSQISHRLMQFTGYAALARRRSGLALKISTNAAVDNYNYKFRHRLEEGTE